MGLSVARKQAIQAAVSVKYRTKVRNSPMARRREQVLKRRDRPKESLLQDLVLPLPMQGKCRMKGNVLDSVIGIYEHEYDGDLTRTREIVEQAFSCLCVTK